MSTLLEGRLGFRLGLYEPGREEDREYVGPEFEPCQLSARTMKETLDAFTHGPETRIGVFIVESADEDG